jgi:hypothetical protein
MQQFLTLLLFVSLAAVRAGGYRSLQRSLTCCLNFLSHEKVGVSAGYHDR